MTLEELYQEIGGNYQSICERLRKEERIRKFVCLFLKDQSYQLFADAMNVENTEEAFRAVHTLKGVCMNLSFDALYQISSEITEYLRVNDFLHAKELEPALTACYRNHVRAIEAYIKEAVC